MRRIWLSLALLGATGACAEIAGLGDLPDVDAQAPEAGGDARVEGGGSDGAADVQPFDAEKCGDGGVCVDVPSGYTAVEYGASVDASCAPGFASPTSVLENPQPLASTCKCTSCQTPNPTPTCSCGPDPVAFDVSWSTTTTCTSPTTVEQFASSTCYSQAQSIGTTSNSFSIKPDAGCVPVGGTCKASTVTNANFTTTHSSGLRCDLADAGAGACSGGTSCLPEPAGASLCVTDGTMNACPAPFAVEHVVGASVVDTRSCNCAPCTLDAGACATTVTFYGNGNSNCAFAGATVPANGTCIKTSVSGSSAASYASTDVGASCGGGAAFVDGGISLGDSYRICCLP